MEKTKSILTETKNIIEVDELSDALLATESSSCTSSFVIKKELPDHLTILDCTGGKDAFENFLKDRIPGAKFLDLDNKFLDPEGKFPTTFPPESIVRKRFGQLGIQQNDEIICYSQTEVGRFAARAWFIIKSYGFHNCAVLNGGLLKWKSQNYPTEEGKVYENEDEEFKGDLEEPRGHLANYEKIRTVEDDPENFIIIDARSQAQHEGKEAPVLKGCKAGAIPNSISIPSSTVVNKDGTLKSVDLLKEIFDNQIKGKEDKEFICHWNNGNSATEVALALKEIGIKKVKLYDGGWSEYGTLTNDEAKKD